MGGTTKAERLIKDRPFETLRGYFPVDVVDRLAVAMKLSLPKRAAGHAWWSLLDSAPKGQSGAKMTYLATKLRFDMELPAPTIESALKNAVDEGLLVCSEDGIVQTPGYYEMEQRVAKEVARRKDAACNDLNLANPGNHPAIDMVSSTLLSIVTGGPGTGKTTIVREIIASHPDLTIKVTAPTGRAARNTQGRTVHYFKTIQEAGMNEFQGAELIIVDEASMLTTDLFLIVLTMAPETAHIVLVGDVDQLPPVGPGEVLRDLLETKACPVTVLDTNYRNPNGISAFAQGILRGEITLPEDDSVTILESHTMDDTLDILAPMGCHVLTPHNATRMQINQVMQLHRWASQDGLEITLTKDFGEFPKGSSGVAFLREDGLVDIEGDGGCRFRGTIPAVLNLVHAAADRGGAATEGGMAMRPGDKVIVTKNVPDGSACNGDIGTLVSASVLRATVDLIQGDRELASRVCIEAETPGTFARQLTLAYATTIHKAQGSEFPVVALPVTNHSAWDRVLLYTGVTRAKSKVIIVGTREALESIVQTHRSPRGSTLQKALLRWLQ